ncbi:GMC oxidoreductase [Amanita thiersii Skay4041]|uniref:GMC oxidoreductase n=1 Tax=Amanita thiersii Skay4041 TaxID=703135 RepID=A0A2A9NHF0_9AGAR|nr:GMC oxidoreductase [Amanita thiersii Skay4041]
MSSDTVYDIIFAGGGAAACVTAGRLAAADPSLKILIIEAGPHIRDVPDHVQPALYFRNLARAADTFSLHLSQPSQSLGGRGVVVPSGRCLGGGSGINFIMYTRAAASDYDDWEAKYKNPGWGSKDLIPLLKKAETYEPGGPTHGSNGPIHVSFRPDRINVGEQFLEVASKYDKERTSAKDSNDFETCNVYAPWAQYVHPVTGRRSDTAHHYIYNQIDGNPNLVVLTRKKVVKVLFEGNQAVGVEYIDDIQGRSKQTVTPSIAKASRLVVVSAGAFGSPAILERSGIGNPEILKKYDILQIVDLPGVGENYMDHNRLFLPYFVSDDADTLDTIFREGQSAIQSLVDEWTKTGKGLLTHNSIDAGIKMRPNAEDLRVIGPEFEQRWNEYFANTPDKPVMWIGALGAYAGTNPDAPRRKMVTMGYYSEYPVSVGHAHITSATDLYSQLNFHAGFLDNPVDLGILRWAYKKSREYIRRMKMYRGEYSEEHPQFSKGSKAGTGPAEGPVDINAPDIVYSAEDDKIIDDFTRRNVETTWHSIGTCAMKPREKMGVVDPRLNVYGTKGLKVADCSITPSNVGANTYNTALAIGEKAAMIIAEDLEIKGV